MLTTARCSSQVAVESRLHGLTSGRVFDTKSVKTEAWAHYNQRTQRRLTSCTLCSSSHQPPLRTKNWCGRRLSASTPRSRRQLCAGTHHWPSRDRPRQLDGEELLGEEEARLALLDLAAPIARCKSLSCAKPGRREWLCLAGSRRRVGHALQAAAQRTAVPRDRLAATVHPTASDASGARRSRASQPCCCQPSAPTQSTAQWCWMQLHRPPEACCH